MNILISGYYGGNNFGDELILHAFTKLLKDHNITVASYFPENLKQPVIQSPSFTKRWKGISYYKKHLKNQDALIIGGGQLLQDATSWEFIASHALLAFIAKLQKKKVILYGVGAGPIRGNLAKHLTKQLLNIADSIVVRDEDSKTVLEQFTNKQIRIAPDPVLSLPVKTSAKNTIGLSLREYNLPKEKIAEIKRFLNKLPKKYTIKLFATENDQHILKKIGKNITHFSSPDDLKKFNVSVMISMRLHFLILAKSANIPAIGLSYCPKVEGFCKQQNIPYIDTNNITEDSLTTLFTNLRKPRKTTYKENLQELKTKNNAATQKLQLHKAICFIYIYFIIKLCKRMLRLV